MIIFKSKIEVNNNTIYLQEVEQLGDRLTSSLCIIISTKFTIQVKITLNILIFFKNKTTILFKIMDCILQICKCESKYVKKIINSFINTITKNEGIKY